MTVSAAPASARRRPERHESSGLLLPAEAGRRNRRTIDGVLLAAASIVLGLAAAIAAAAVKEDEAVEHGLTTLLGWADPFWRVAWVGALGLAAVVVVDILVRRRWLLLRDLFVALAIVGGLGMVLGGVVISDWSPLDAHLLSGWGFPELRLAWTTAILVVAGPELVRPVRETAAVLVPLAALGATVLGAALPSAALAGIAFGLCGAALVRLLFGTAAGFPSAARVRGELASLGIDTRALHPSARQRVGSAVFVGEDDEGGPLTARVLGRDAQDTQRLARRWRQLAYRDPPRSVAVGRLEQVEHEALATLMAAQAGVRVPPVVTASLGDDGDAIVVLRQPDVEPLESAGAGEVSDDLLESLWLQVSALHAAGISHGRLNASNVAVVDGDPLLLDFAAATLGAPKPAIDIDVAELLVACTVLVGPDRALAAAVRGAGEKAVAGALPYLERGALTPHLRDLARHNDVALEQLRKSSAAATNEQLPDIVPLRRVRPRDVLTTALVILAAYLLISKLARIGFGTIYGELREANPVWVVVALIVAQLTYVSQAVALRGAVETPLPLLPVVVLKSAVKFLNLTVPGSAGSVALGIRFLQRLGVPTGGAVASGMVDDLTATLVEILLVVTLLPFVHVNLDAGSLGGAMPSKTFVIAVFAALIGAVVVVMVVPVLRNRVLPSVRQALRSVSAVARDRRKRLELFGGALATEVIFALTLGAAAGAYGVHLSLAQLILVNVAASTLSGLVPVPGGIGAAEAGLTAGLVAMGVPEATAFAVALTHRLCTYYLPPVWGYFSLQWLRHRGNV
jgi:uncharacterized membrane protein YbhN (UPF0104 family)/tRNA A-37 threonylcarbamoyl transferase component Bud32